MVIICLSNTHGFDRAAQGIAGAGRRLADEVGEPLHAIIIGRGATEMVPEASAVADEITIADHPWLDEYQPERYLSALCNVCQKLAPRVVLLGNDTYGQELAPRLAHRLGGSAVGDAVKVGVEAGKIRVFRNVYGGKAMAAIELKRSPAVIWLRARAFAPAAPRQAEDMRVMQVSHASLEIPEEPRTRIVERAIEAREDARLEDARVIVSGGRGLGGPEPFRDLEQLASLIGGQMAASRAACDAGWAPPGWQVGQTGKKVAPELYLAIAIHGASQHLAGISDARVIAAINIDPEAPIFKHCRFGIVEDYRKVVPLLREKLGSRAR
jgi:electron transfer flavoprotein alpha subunit